MSDTETSPLPQEIIGLPKDETAEVEGLLKDIRARYKECLSPILVDREKVDPRVIQLEKQLHELNEKRAAFYGREYNPPEILYIDRVQGTFKSTEINDAIKKEELEMFGFFDANAGTYQTMGNYIVAFVNNFDDKDVDSWDVCRKIRHELSHAGSVRKHRAYRDENGKVDYQGYRMGARLNSINPGRSSMGIAIDEGHHAIEDEIFEGLHPKLLEQDEFINTLPNGQQLFPDAKQKYDQLRQVAISRGEIRSDQMLMSYRINNGMYLVGTANLYEDYGEIMKLIYKRSPEMFRLARDFIYGDKMIVFGRKVDQTFGRGFFHSLMAVKDEDSADKMISELK